MLLYSWETHFYIWSVACSSDLSIRLVKITMNTFHGLDWLSKKYIFDKISSMKKISIHSHYLFKWLYFNRSTLVIDMAAPPKIKHDHFAHWKLILFRKGSERTHYKSEKPSYCLFKKKKVMSCFCTNTRFCQKEKSIGEKNSQLIVSCL